MTAASDGNSPQSGGYGGEGGKGGKANRRRGKGRGKDRWPEQGKYGGYGGQGGDGGWWRNAPSPEALEGEWKDSLGHAVIVEWNGRRNAPLSVKLVRGEREQTLSLRYDSHMDAWACGNAVLDINMSSPGNLVWITPDGRRSVWCRGDESQTEEENARPPDLLPWLLVPTEAQVDARTRPRWSSIAEEGPEEGDETAAAPRKESGAAESKEAKSKDAAGSEAGTDERAAQDGARVATVLDMRQVLGNDRSAQDKLSAILMDHALVMRDNEDPMIPSADSSLWGRLPEVPRRNALYCLKNFSVDNGTPAELAEKMCQVRCGRHCFQTAPIDIQTLSRRWMGPPNSEDQAAKTAQVLALYNAGENPLLGCHCRNDMHLAWDPSDRKRVAVEYELFASPFNARVANLRYASRWPHVEASFGSIGMYPNVIDEIPESASVGVHPPFTDVFLDHVFGQNLERLVKRFSRVCLTVPVRNAPWRPKLQRLTGATFAKQFWDCTMQAPRPLSHPVLFWEGSELGPAV